MLKYFNKKSQEQFSWIFVIIAGAIILSFFVMFGFKYIDLQTKKENALLTSSVYNSIYSLQKTEFSTEAEIDLTLKKDVKVACNSFSIGNYISKSLSDEFVFAPMKMQSNKLYIYMKTWDYPFRIANFFYLTSPERSYTVVYDSSSEEFVKSLYFPKNFNVKVTTSDDKRINNKIVYFYDTSKGMSIEPKEYGYLKINGKKYPFFGKSMIYGAIFTDNYECMLEKSLNKYKLLVDIYEGKAQLMFFLKPSCNYDRIKFDLSKLGKAIESRKYEDIFTLSKSIEGENKDIVSMNCEPLF